MNSPPDGTHRVACISALRRRTRNIWTTQVGPSKTDQPMIHGSRKGNTNATTIDHDPHLSGRAIRCLRGGAADPAATIEAHVTAYNLGDLDAAMSLFTDESVIVGHGSR